MKTYLKIASLVLLITASFYVAVVKYRAAKELQNPTRLNYLVLSFCSLRADAVLPNVERFFSTGFKFDNAINPNPWTTLFHHLKRDWPKLSRDYEIVADPGKVYTRIPIRTGEVGEEKDYAAALEAFRARVLKSRDKPFLAVAHITYMHYPYATSPNERADRYAREGRADKQPFIMAMRGVPDYRAMGLIANPEALARWQKSEGFEEDVRQLRAAYAESAARLDRFILEALNLWGDRNLQKNTAVIFLGDHGEMLMEHNELTHATSLYEEALKFPFYMKFPGQTGGLTHIQEQIQMTSIATMLEALTAGALRPAGVPAFFRAHAREHLTLRDCANKVRGVRTANRWKYFVRAGDGERFLFDLGEDPGEQKNLASVMPEKLNELEQVYWAHEPEFAKLPKKRCASAE